MLHIKLFYNKQEFQESTIVRKFINEQVEVVPPKEIIDLIEEKTKMGNFYGVEQVISNLMQKDHTY